jgi:hypothetical protein
MRWVRLTTFGFVLFQAIAPGLEAQGFGKIKKHVVLRRKLPPIAHLTGSFTVQASARDPQYVKVAQKTADILETEILNHDNQLLDDKIKPDTIITLNVVNYSPPRMITVTKTNYTTKGPLPQPVQEVSGSIVVSYQAKSAKTSRVLDSDNVAEKVSGEYEPGGATKTVTNALRKPLHVIHPGSRENEPAAAPKDLEEVAQMLISRGCRRDRFAAGQDRRKRGRATGAWQTRRPEQARRGRSMGPPAGAS